MVYAKKRIQTQEADINRANIKLLFPLFAETLGLSEGYKEASLNDALNHYDSGTQNYGSGIISAMRSNSNRVTLYGRIFKDEIDDKLSQSLEGISDEQEKDIRNELKPHQIQLKKQRSVPRPSLPVLGYSVGEERKMIFVDPEDNSLKEWKGELKFPITGTKRGYESDGIMKRFFMTYGETVEAQFHPDQMDESYLETLIAGSIKELKDVDEGEIKQLEALDETKGPSATEAYDYLIQNLANVQIKPFTGARRKDKVRKAYRRAAKAKVQSIRDSVSENFDLLPESAASINGVLDAVDKAFNGKVEHLREVQIKIKGKGDKRAINTTTKRKRSSGCPNIQINIQGLQSYAAKDIKNEKERIKDINEQKREVIYRELSASLAGAAMKKKIESDQVLLTQENQTIWEQYIAAVHKRVRKIDPEHFADKDNLESFLEDFQE